MRLGGRNFHIMCNAKIYDAKRNARISPRIIHTKYHATYRIVDIMK